MRTNTKKIFSDKLLEFNVKLAPSPLIGHFTFIFTFDREPNISIASLIFI